MGQSEKIDSLKAVLKSNPVPAQKTDLLLKIAKAVYTSYPDSSLRYCEEAKTISKASKLNSQYGFSLLCEVRYELLKGDIKTSAKKISEALEVFEKAGDKKGIAKSYMFKSNLAGRLDNKEENLSYLQRAKEIYVAIKDTEGLSSVLVNLSNSLHDLRRFEEALAELDQLKKLGLPESTNDFFSEVNYGMIFLETKKYALAISHFQKCIEISRKYKMLDSEITGLTMLAEAYRAVGNANEAISNYNQALELARANKLMVEETDALKGATILYERQKDFEKAYFSLKRFKRLQDSLFNIEKIKSIQEIENRLKLSEKEKIIAEQNLFMEKEKAELDSSKARGWMMGGGIAILVIVLILLYVHVKRTGKLYALIQVQKKEVEKQKELIETKNKEVMDSINYARHIQGSMLPSEKEITKLFPENFVLYKPKDVVAGDFYWIDSSVSGQHLIAACDCTGHGVPGAMVSIVACSALNRAVKEFKLSDPAKIFDKVNELMQETFSKSGYEVNDGMDGVLCAMDTSKMQLSVAAANNPVWIVGPVPGPMGRETQLELTQLSPDKRPVGKHVEEQGVFSLKTINVEKGEMIYLFTDGYADQFGGPKGKKFKYKQMQEVLLSIAHQPLDKQKQILDLTIENWRGGLEQVDDMLIIGIRI